METSSPWAVSTVNRCPPATKQPSPGPQRACPPPDSHPGPRSPPQEWEGWHLAPQGTRTGFRPGWPHPGRAPGPQQLPESSEPRPCTHPARGSGVRLGALGLGTIHFRDRLHLQKVKKRPRAHKVPRKPQPPHTHPQQPHAGCTPGLGVGLTWR